MSFIVVDENKNKDLLTLLINKIKSYSTDNYDSLLDFMNKFNLSGLCKSSEVQAKQFLNYLEGRKIGKII